MFQTALGLGVVTKDGFNATTVWRIDDGDSERPEVVAQLAAETLWCGADRNTGDLLLVGLHSRALEPSPDDVVAWAIDRDGNSARVDVWPDDESPRKQLVWGPEP